ncbi:ubiquinone biosynthesis methyltransferase [Klebsormidium nitens]|uniref:2-methoxy-6-polyprenyl-1,4-benzoquinol methylase, mitochondrial n=1 Tax=Klebsormidium nitens TaxID=105231 RepID=A0A1Y1I416_KLENI|nr:ubiquinone biosynthesis methyltransferase [Klebsormidium nitens]|eukprot:GAQ83476.1 ubiquinone biosynthesis methyltransferase [Klebsormidium nitens]
MALRRGDQVLKRLSPRISLLCSRLLAPEQSLLDRESSHGFATTSGNWQGASGRDDAADFGYKKVSREEKTTLVGEVFKNVAPSYDLMNDLMSGGMHRLWKDRFVKKLHPFVGMQHLDVAGGTGDIAFRVLDAIREQEPKQEQAAWGPRSSVVVCDINPAMLEVGKKRAQERGLGEASGLQWVEGNAEKLPFEDASFDTYSIVFGIRNVTDIEAALREAHRVLKPGGRFLCMEFSQVRSPTLRALYDAYSFSVIPVLGDVVARDRASYQYLVESIRKFPSQKKFASMIAAAGFQEVTYENLVAGAVAIHSGFKL